MGDESRLVTSCCDSVKMVQKFGDHHLLYVERKPFLKNTGINYQPQLVTAGFLNHENSSDTLYLPVIPVLAFIHLENSTAIKSRISSLFGPFFKKAPRFFIQGKKPNPIGSMYGIFTYIYHKNQLNVGKYTIHGWYGNWQRILI